jgi:apolipoprotein N-acyltransferase
LLIKKVVSKLLPFALLPFTSSVLTILIFPKFNLDVLAWVALVPLMYSINAECRFRSAEEGILNRKYQLPHSAFRIPHSSRSFFLGWISGTIAYTGILYWIVVTFNAAHQGYWLSIPSLLLLAAYIGLFWGIWGIYLTRIHETILFPVLAAAGWVTMEYLRTYFLSGFPWALLGDSQVRHLSLIQISSFTAVYGVSFLIVLVNATIVLLLRKKTFSAVLITAIIFSSVYAFGRHRVHTWHPEGKNVRVALLQGNIDQYMKWDIAYENAIKTTYADLVQKASASHPDLIVWPETSVPGYLMQDPPLQRWLKSVIKPTDALNLVGAPSLQGESSLNAAFLLSPEGYILGRYAKRHLVPFGEIVPFGFLLGHWIHVLNELGGFAAGRDEAVLTAPAYKAGVNICYEAIFPNLVRQSVLEGAGFIVNLTNDGWYMRTAAPYQHFVPNVYRAVENNRWLVRADNTGISAIIDPVGHVVAATPIFQNTWVEGTVLAEGTKTFYTKYGDVFAWFCVLVSLLSII